MTNEEIVESVGERIRELRGDRQTADMARAAGVQWDTWYRWETGEFKPSLVRLAKIADALGVKVCLFEDAA